MPQILADVDLSIAQGLLHSIAQGLLHVQTGGLSRLIGRPTTPLRAAVEAAVR